MQYVTCRKKFDSALEQCPQCGAAVSEFAAIAASRPAPIAPDPPQRVTVTDLNISFGNMVVLMVKLAIASIPAAIILGLVWMFVVGGIWGAISTP